MILCKYVGMICCEIIHACEDVMILNVKWAGVLTDKLRQGIQSGIAKLYCL